MRYFTEIENEKYEKMMTHFSEGNFNFPLMHDIVVLGSGQSIVSTPGNLSQKVFSKKCCRQIV